MIARFHFLLEAQRYNQEKLNKKAGDTPPASINVTEAKKSNYFVAQNQNVNAIDSQDRENTLQLLIVRKI